MPKKAMPSNLAAMRKNRWKGHEKKGKQPRKYGERNGRIFQKMMKERALCRPKPSTTSSVAR